MARPTLAVADDIRPAGHTLPTGAGAEDSPLVTFATLWAGALESFKLRTKVQNGRWQRLLDQFQACRTVDDVCAIFDEDMRALVRLRADDSTWGRFRDTFLQPVVDLLFVFNDAVVEVADNFPAVPGAKAIFVALGMLLEATRGITAYLEALMGLFEEIRAFLGGLHLRLASPTTLGPASQKIAIAILAHLLDVCFCAMKVLSKRPWLGRLAIYWRTLTKDDDVRDALQRMRQLITLESHAVLVETRVEMSNVRDATSEVQGVTIENYELTRKLLRRQVAAETQSRNIVERSINKLLKSSNRVEEAINFLRAERKDYASANATKVFMKLNPVMHADIDNQSPEGCMKGTRVRVLKDLRVWSRDPDAPQIFWLNGMAGTGKSAIARSFCHILRQDSLLGGSFFCSRGGSVEEGNVQRIIPTLAATMSKSDATYNKALLTMLEREPFSIQWNIQLQIERLLSGPLGDMQSQEPKLIVFVIDALDECADEHGTRDLLVRLVRLSGSLPAKFFLTSRPEPHLRGQLETMDPNIGKVLRLHDIEVDIVKADISLYLTNELRAMRQSTFPAAWPFKADVAKLTRLSGKLFIYAFTALQYLRRDPVSRLKKLTGNSFVAGRPLTKPLDEIYNLILSEAMNPDEYDLDELDMTRSIIAIIVTMREPLSMSSLSDLLGMPVDRIKGALNRLYAVIYVPVRDDSGALSTFHASFGDFVTTPGRSPQSMNDRVVKSHRDLASTCIKTMQSDQLCFNIGRVYTSHLPNSEQDVVGITDVMRYACLHWGHHVANSHDLHLLNYLERVLAGPKFLFWLEVMSILGLSEKALDILAAAQAIKHVPEELSKFLEAAIAFINDFSLVIAQSTPHIYCSALARCHPASLVAERCLHWFSNLPRVVEQDIAGALPIRPACVTYSPNGKTIVAGMFNGTIHQFNSETGVPVNRAHKVHTRTVLSIGFSREGAQILSASKDKSLASWKTYTESENGIVYLPSIERCDWIRGVAFSRDGLLVASGTPDYLLEIRNTHTGKVIQRLTGHEGYIRAVDFSRGGDLVASGSTDCSVCLWDVASGRLRFPPFRGHKDIVLCVAFTPDGVWLLSGGADAQVCIWDTVSGINIKTYSHHHNDAIWSLACSPNNLHVASGSDDGTICIWELNTGEPTMDPLNASAIWSIDFSPDGSHLVSASYDRIYVWDVAPAPADIHRKEDRKDVLETDPAGWLRSSAGDLLTWVGKGNHEVHYLPRCTMVIGSRKRNTLVTSFGVRGARWTRCYTHAMAISP